MASEAILAEVSAQAAEVRFGRVAATVFLGIFTAVGWIIGRTWYAMAFCGLAIRYGFRQGAKVSTKSQSQQAAPPPDGL